MQTLKLDDSMLHTSCKKKMVFFLTDLFYTWVTSERIPSASVRGLYQVCTHWRRHKILSKSATLNIVWAASNKWVMTEYAYCIVLKWIVREIPNIQSRKPIWLFANGKKNYCMQIAQLEEFVSTKNKSANQSLSSNLIRTGLFKDVYWSYTK